MIDPLKIWHTQQVKNLLTDFFKANFAQSGIDESIGQGIVDMSWEARDRKGSLDEKRQVIDQKFQNAKQLVTNKITEANSIDLFDYSNVKTYLDVGANKLDTINYLSTKYSNIEKFIGIDIIPQKGVFLKPDKCVYYQTDPDASEFPIESNSVDLINIQFVFHHFENLDAIKRMLQNCKQALNKGGRLILWEETFVDQVDIDSLCSGNQKINIQTDKEFTKRFYDLTTEQRWEFIIANDWIINVKNPHMPWTGQYYKWSEWKELLSQYSLELNKELNLGLRINGRLKQGVHILGEFISR
ncbi:MAG: class I SAM-dependent methyltransferase [Candidatus Dojkabacteria bacterium]